ncbi:MAG TPA: ChaN family lipoprotein [Gemmataceae bacterium]|nr:ChaN family lipoprotein [Gemmataceae bacterium]
MLRMTCLFSAVLLLPGVGLAAETPEATLRQLEKDIAAVRGLAFIKPVVAKVIPRPKDADRHTQGYYSPHDKTLYLYDDVAGNYRRGTLIHEMVHALQDQHFGLSHLHESNYGSDADLAHAALIEGDATFTMIEVLKKDQPKVAAMLDVPLDKAKNLQNAFLYAQGARYVRALKAHGGWEAVNQRYKFPPEATAEILHPEGVSVIDLGPGNTVGEYGIIRMLHACPETAPLAVQAASGWRGDREIDDGSAKAWVVAFATPDNGRRFRDAMIRLRSAERPGLHGPTDPSGSDVWHDGKGRALGFLVRGSRVLLLDAPDDSAYRTLLDRMEGPPTLLIHSVKEKRSLTFGEFIDRLMADDLVCVGEDHDSELNHRVQLEIIKALYARDERLGVGMEMFQRPFQPAVDRYLKGEGTEDEFLKATEYQKRWGFDWALYRPIVDFCRKNGVALAALNAPRELTRRISKVGVAGLTADEKRQLGPVDFHVPAHRAYWYERLAKMHGNKNPTAEQKERSYDVMTTWDGYMAASAAQFQKGRGLRRLVVLAGSGHIDRGFGIPDRAAKQTGGKVATVHVTVGDDPAKAFAEPVADYIIVVK